MSQTKQKSIEESLKRMLAHLDALPKTPVGDHFDVNEMACYVEETLSGDHLSRFERHLESCPACARQLEAMFAAADYWARQDAAQPAPLSPLVQSLAQGIRRVKEWLQFDTEDRFNEWFQFDAEGTRLCSQALAGGLLADGESKACLPDGLPLAVRGLELKKNGGLAVYLNWLSATPEYGPAVELGDVPAQPADAQWHNWQAAPRSAQILEIKHCGLSADRLDAARAQGRILIALNWQDERNVLRIKLLPDA
ncbi:anti-sigma factor family protein [Candidatus Methylomicrobium oryzae]|uniref:anti-sigma factor family protein n=1 Tax=Candidatus Methylomicrobium oryzae TaxID=2802053 RepID=UPI0019216E57|nr:zf-HC2 domain-containing protein [Methylomicrobium sp. RS1]MBL1263511.1 zf-HC2 domain-containing protein [Methylomicrobium sp. RS1]